MNTPSYPSATGVLKVAGGDALPGVGVEADAQEKQEMQQEEKQQDPWAVAEFSSMKAQMSSLNMLVSNLQGALAARDERDTEKAAALDEERQRLSEGRAELASQRAVGAQVESALASPPPSVS
jgi:hypothetical protein